MMASAARPGSPLGLGVAATDDFCTDETCSGNVEGALFSLGISSYGHWRLHKIWEQSDNDPGEIAATFRQ